MRKIILLIPSGVLSLLVTAAVAYLSLAPDPVGEDFFFFHGADKVAHCLMYLGITLVYTYDLIKACAPHHTKVNKELVVTALAMLLGLVMESAQLGMGLGRSFEATDIAANSMGALMGFGLQRLWLGHHMREFIFPRHHHHHHHHHKSH